MDSRSVGAVTDAKAEKVARCHTIEREGTTALV
jgi:hypothetical protein